jgi:hypothetical protein
LIIVVILSLALKMRALLMKILGYKYAKSGIRWGRADVEASIKA